jgi:hypothetical protein
MKHCLRYTDNRIRTYKYEVFTQPIQSRTISDTSGRGVFHNLWWWKSVTVGLLDWFKLQWVTNPVCIMQVGSKNRIVWMAWQQEFMRCNLPIIAWGRQFWFVIAIPKYFKCGNYLMFNDCLCIVFLSFVVISHAALLCSLRLLVDPLQVLPLYYKLWVMDSLAKWPNHRNMNIFTWLRIGIVGRLSWIRWWTFGFWRHGVSSGFRGLRMWSLRRVVW